MSAPRANEREVCTHARIRRASHRDARWVDERARVAGQIGPATGTGCQNGRVTDRQTPSGGPEAGGGWGKLRTGARLIRDLVSRQPRDFAVAVTGAAVFATFTAASSLGVRWLIDRVFVPRFEQGSVAWLTVLGACSVIVVISLVRAVGVVVRRTFAGKTEWGVAGHVTLEVVERYAAQPIPWHDSHVRGDLVARAGVDVDTSVAVLAPLPYGSSVVLLLVISAVGLMVTDVGLGLVALILLPLLVVANLVYQQKVDVHFNDAQEEMGRLSSAVLESFEGVSVVKAFGAEARETARLSGIAAGLRDARVRAVRSRAIFEMVLDAVPSFANLVLLMVGALRVRSGHVTVGELASSMYLFTLLVVPLRLIGYVFAELPRSLAGWRRVRAIMSEPVAEDPREARGSTDDSTALELSLVGLRLGNVDILRDVSFRVARGRHTAIVGPTGVGKSTLLRAVAGAVPVESGTIDVPAGGVGLVQQEPFIFSESVRFNLTLGKEVDESTVTEALRIADAEFLVALDKGLETPLGERGANLSGGQRQRLALARELIARPSLLLLDDTTSAVDPETELRILDRIVSSPLVETVVMVASRPSTIDRVDSVIFIDEDKKVHSGTHADLLSSQPDYRRLIEAFEDDRKISGVGR